MRLYLLAGFLLTVGGVLLGYLYAVTAVPVALSIGACIAVVLYLTVLGPLRSHASERKTFYGREVYRNIQSLVSQGYDKLVPNGEDQETAYVLIGMDAATSEAVITRFGWGTTCLINTVRRRYVVSRDGSVKRYLDTDGAKKPSKRDFVWCDRLLCNCRLKYLLRVVQHSYSSRAQIVRQ